MDASDEQEGGLREQSLQRRLLWIVPLLILLGLLIYGSLTEVDPSGASGQQAPEFELALLGGGTISHEDLEGHPVVLNFWASWCAPCREEAPLLEEMWREYEDQGVRFIGINVQDNEVGAAEFVEEFAITYPIALDPDDDLATELDVLGLPQTFFIDREGRFLGAPTGPRLSQRGDTVVFGAITESALRGRIEALLDKGSSE